MLQLAHPRTPLLTLLVIPLVVAPPPARGATASPAPKPCRSCGGLAGRVPPAADATSHGRDDRLPPGPGKSVLGQAQTRALAARCLPGSPLARRQAILARGARVLARELGHTTTAVSCRVTVGELPSPPRPERPPRPPTWSPSSPGPTRGADPTPRATVSTMSSPWCETTVAGSSPATPVRPISPRVCSRTPARRRRPSRRRRAARSSCPQPVGNRGTGHRPCRRPAGRRGGCGRRAARLLGQAHLRPRRRQGYADKYALSYNPTCTSFSSDCADFGSQVMYAGGYPQFGSTYASGWWYDENGTSSPTDDSYSHSLDRRGQPAGGVERQVHRLRLVDRRRRQGRLRLLRLDRRRHVGPRGRTRRHQHRGQRSSTPTPPTIHVFWKLGTTATHSGSPAPAGIVVV